MITVTLIGIGTGNPDHLTHQAVRAMNEADLILIPRKGADKADLAELRERLCDAVLATPGPRRVAFDLPRRDTADPDYLGGVTAWHRAIAASWSGLIRAGIGTSGRVAFLVWGDPSLYDSSLRIAAMLDPDLMVTVRVIPGITAIQALTAAHAIPLNRLGAPVLVTTGRQLRDHGWPAAADRIVVMLDGSCAFRTLDPTGLHIWWGAYLGMAEEVTAAGPLARTGPQILALRADARATHGWIMDTYLLARSGADPSLSSV